MKLAFWIAAVPALLGSTAVLAQDGVGSFFGIGASAGVSVLKMPTGQNGILTSGDVTVTGGGDPLIIAPTVGFSTAVGLGKVGDFDAFAGLNLFATYGTGNANITQNFSGLGTVIIPGMSLPDSGSITLTTTRGATSAQAGTSVTNVPPQGGGPYTDTSTATSGPAPGSQSDAFVGDNPGNPSFIVGGSNTTVTGGPGGTGTALSYGGIADTSGSILIITGDLAGLSISTNTSTSVLYAGGDLTVGVTKQQDDATSVQAYAGPSYRYIGQWINTNVGTNMTVNIPEAAAPTVHPLWIQDTTFRTTLGSHYFGGVVGAGVSHRVSENTSIALGAEASAYYLTAHLGGQSTVTTQDGLPGPSPTVTVVSDQVDTLLGELAFAARAQASATVDVSENMGVTLAGSIDYLSKVARPYANAVVIGSDGNASWNSADPGNSGISFGDMFAFTGTVTLAGHF